MQMQGLNETRNGNEVQAITLCMEFGGVQGMYGVLHEQLCLFHVEGGEGVHH